MAATIKIKNSSTAGAAPTSSDLVQGELAVNVTDKRLYTENASGTVVELGTNPSVPVTFPDGSASAPSLTNDGDTNTGLFFPAADTVSITTGGTERARVDSSGNLGLGVTPSAWATFKVMQIGNGTADTFIAVSGNQGDFGVNAYYNAGWKYQTSSVAASRYEQSSGVHQWFNAPSGTAGNAITFTQAMTLDASGNLFLGATSAGFAEKFRVYGNYSVFDNGTFTGFIGSGSSLGTGTGSDFAIRSSNAIAFLSGGATERARIDSSGNLLVGTTSLGSTAVGFGINGNSSSSSRGACISVINSSVNGNTTYEAYSLSASAYRFYVGMAGTVYATNTTITAISDQRLKENIRDLDEGLATVMALKPRKFDWKAGKGADIKNARGFIAQEFEQVLPDMIEEWRDPAPEGEEPYKAINANLIPTLVKAIQEQQAIITQLQADVVALKGQA